jgi:hypothetical protein
MPRTQVLEYVEKSLAGSSNAADTVATMLIDGKLSPKDFGGELKGELKAEYIRQYLLGKGGREQMGPRDWGSIGGMLKEQYKYLPDFIKEIEAGNLTEAQIRARVNMYTNSAREGYERAHERNAEKLGMTQEKWELGEAEHCEDCVAYAAQGWQPFGTFPTPGAGDTRCMTNCKCQVIYQNPETGARY